MKRTGIFALAATCALGVTALVGGVGYASALDVAEQAGQTLDVAGVSTVDTTSHEVSDSTTSGKDKSTPTTEPTDPATVPPVAEPPVDDDGTADQGSVDEVDPSDPVVIPDDGTTDPKDKKSCGKGDRGTFRDGAKDAAVESDGSWGVKHDGTRGGKHDQAAPDQAAPAPTVTDDTVTDGEWTKRWGDSAREGSDRSLGDGARRGGEHDDRSDRGGDRGQRGGGHGHGGGGHHGGRG